MFSFCSRKWNRIKTYNIQILLDSHSKVPWCFYLVFLQHFCLTATQRLLFLIMYSPILTFLLSECRFTTCWWTLGSWTTHMWSTRLTTDTTSVSSDWSRGNPCPTSLTSECPFTSAAQMWRQEACECVSNDTIQETSQRQPSKLFSGFRW